MGLGVVLLGAALPLAVWAVELVPVQGGTAATPVTAPAEPPASIPPAPKGVLPIPVTGAGPAAHVPPVPVAGSPGPAVAQAPALKPGEMLFNFQDADVAAVVKTVSQITGRNFLLDPRVKGKITIISARPVGKDAAYEIFVSALKAQGFSTMDGPGGIVKVIPEAEAKLTAPVVRGPRNSDQWVTQVITIEHASAAQLVPLLRPMLSPNALLSVYAPANTLVMTDTAASIRNVLGVIERIDQRGSTEVNVIPLKHTSAVDMAQLVGRFGDAPTAAMPGQPQPAPAAGMDLRLIVVPDMRTNSLLVRADNPARVEELRQLVTKLDVPARAGGQTHVVYLRNAEAKKLAEILRGLIAGEARAASATPAAAPGQPQAAAGTPRAAEASLVQADEATNALIINAPDAVYNNLRGVIEKLDTRRAQVYVEALIVEMSSTLANQFGVQWAGGVPSGSGAIGAVTNFQSGSSVGIISAVGNPTALAGQNGLTIGYIGKEVTLPNGQTVRGIGALARALEGEASANILSAPNLLTLDNAEAKIHVGQNVPFLTGSYAQSTGTTTTGGGAVNPFQTIERKDVGLTLKIKPQVSEGSGVRLQLSQEVSSVVPAADVLTRSVNKRTIDTTVVVDDGAIMALGGLIDDRSSESEQGVPFLSHIPFIGWLFRYKEKTKEKTNLMVFLRPVIVRGAEDAVAFTNERYEYLERGGVARSRTQKELLKRFDPAQSPPKKPEAAPPAGEAPAPEAATAPEPQAAAPAAATAAPEASAPAAAPAEEKAP